MTNVPNAASAASSSEGDALLSNRGSGPAMKV
jgi:hypothetical protein